MQNLKPRIAEEKVVQATGHGWQYWLDILDNAKGEAIGHTKMAKLLREEYKLDSWWCQTVTIEYEIVRGLRVPQEKTDGSFAGSVSRRLERGLELIWDDWTNSGNAGLWYGDTKIELKEDSRYEIGEILGTIHRIDAPKRLFINLESGGMLEIRLTELENGKTELLLTTTNLKSQDDAQDWKKKLASLISIYKESLED